MKKFWLVLLAGTMVCVAARAEDAKSAQAAPQGVKKEHKVPTETQKRRAEIQALCRQYRNTPENSRPELKDKIMVLLRQDYESVQADRLKRIENLERQLAKLKDDQNKNEDDVINAEFERLTRPLPKKAQKDKPGSKTRK